MSIGQALAEAREKAGLTVDQVAAATRIRRTLVMDIERDDFSSSGGDFYARGHVRTIAQKVGLDPAPLLAEFDRARPEAAPPRATDVFESETAARPERRGPNWTALTTSCRCSMRTPNWNGLGAIGTPRSASMR